MVVTKWPFMANSKGVSILVFLFFIKFSFFSFFITPLWEVPDEVGHFDYVRSVAKGEFPSPDETLLSDDLQLQIFGHISGYPHKNWIAEHPPLYYIMAAPIYKFVSCLTEDSYFIYRSPRLLSSLFGAFLVYWFFQLFLIVRISAKTAAILASCIGFVPMISHLSSGTQHDIMLFTLSTMAITYLLKGLLSNSHKNVLLSALCLSFASITKATALAAIPLFLLILAFGYKGKILGRTKSVISYLVISLSLPMVWASYQYFTPSNFTNGPELLSPSNYKMGFDLIGLNQFITQTDVLSLFFKHSFGLFGWMGKGNADVLLKAIDDRYFVLYVLILCIVLCLSILSSLKYTAIFKSNGRPNSLTIVLKLTLLLSLIIGTLFFLVDYHLSSFNMTIWYIGIFVFLVIVQSTLNIYHSVYPIDRMDRILSIGWFAFFAFFAIFMLRSYVSWAKSEVLVAVHGRYLYPLSCLFILPLLSRIRYLNYLNPTAMVSVILALLALTEFVFINNSLLPFYEK